MDRKTQDSLKAVIIAAGRGSRIDSETDNHPKTLLPYGERTILYAILQNFSVAGIKNFVIVTGFLSEVIEQYLDENNSFGLSIETVYNPQWEKGNGLSVLVSRKLVGDNPFILSMSDHVVAPEALRKIIGCQSDNNLLLVDPRIDEIFDEEDATKVVADNGMIKEIGKELSVFNCIDCGIFKLDARFYAEMERKKTAGEESISAGVQGLIQMNCMEAVEFDAKNFWIDIDTPDAYKESLKNKHYFNRKT